MTCRRSILIYIFAGGWFGVKLDHRNLRTPLRKVFSVPTEGLAIAVCHEWEAQAKYIQPSLMHLVSKWVVNPFLSYTRLLFQILLLMDLII